MDNNTIKNANNLIKTLALNYVAKYFTTKHKLQQYLIKKLIKLKINTPENKTYIDNIIEEFTEKKYLNDEAYSKIKITALIKNGKSTIAINNFIKHNKLVRVKTGLINEDEELLSALIYIKKKKLACYNENEDTIKTKQKLYTAGFGAHTISTITKLSIDEAHERAQELLQSLTYNE